MLVQKIYQVHKIIRRSITRSRCIITGHLIPPGSVIRMLHNRHQFHMRVTHFLTIIANHRSKFTVVIKFFFGIRRLFKCAKRHFVNKHRLLFRIPFFTLGKPLFIFPVILIQIPYNACRRRTTLCIIAVRICFHHALSVRAPDFIFIQISGTYTRNKQLVNSCCLQIAHRISRCLPVVKITYDANRLCLRRPHSKIRSFHALDCHRMSTQFFINGIVNSVAKLRHVHAVKQRVYCISIRFFNFLFPLFQDKMIRRNFFCRNQYRKIPGLVHFCHFVFFF